MSSTDNLRCSYYTSHNSDWAPDVMRQELLVFQSAAENRLVGRYAIDILGPLKTGKYPSFYADIWDAGRFGRKFYPNKEQTFEQHELNERRFIADVELAQSRITEAA